MFHCYFEDDSLTYDIVCIKKILNSEDLSISMILVSLVFYIPTMLLKVSDKMRPLGNKLCFGFGFLQGFFGGLLLLLFLVGFFWGFFWFFLKTKKIDL